MIAHDAVTVARREVLDLEHPDPSIRRLAIATLAQAVHEMQLTDPESSECCARITHSNGKLVERYIQSADPKGAL